MSYLPNAQLVVGKSMRAQNFFIVSIPDQRTNLTVCIYTVQKTTCICVPKFHGFVCGSSASSQQSSLPWTPGQGFYSSFVALENMPLFSGVDVPNNGQVVVASRGQPTGVMLESADLALMPIEPHADIIGTPHVMPQNGGILGAREQHRPEAQRGDPVEVAPHHPEQRFLLQVVEVDPSLRSPHRDDRAVRVKRHRTDVGLVQTAELTDLPGRVEVDFVVEADCQGPAAAPVHQIEVVVVQQLRRVQDLLGSQTDVPLVGSLLRLGFPADQLVDALVDALGWPGGLLVADHPIALPFLDETLGDEAVVGVLLAIVGSEQERQVVAHSRRSVRDKPVQVALLLPEYVVVGEHLKAGAVFLHGRLLAKAFLHGTLYERQFIISFAVALKNSPIRPNRRISVRYNQLA